MGFLKKFFRNVFHDNAPEVERTSSFETLTEQELETHLAVDRYGDFRLTDAVRPSYDLQVTPQQGFRHDAYRDEETGSQAPVVMAAASREKLFDLFMDLLEPLGDEVDVVLETSHNRRGGDHVDLYRELIDMPILQSTLWDFEDMLLNDGCTGIAVLNPGIPQEVQFDEHKLLIVYGAPLSQFERTFRRYGLSCNEELRFITEGEHVHSSRQQYAREFEQLSMRLGMDATYE